MKTICSVLLFFVLCGSSLATNYTDYQNDDPSPSSIFDLADVQSQRYHINFLNLQLSYNLAVYPEDYHVCDGDVQVLAFIPTRVTAFEVRNAIRNSWIKDRRSNIVVKFVVGRKNDLNLTNLVFEEQREYGDLIIYDIEDTYENLYLKVHAAFDWQQTFCKNARYVLKTDDDTIVDFNRLSYWIENAFDEKREKNQEIIFGRLGKNIKPIRRPGRKWYVSYYVYPYEYYPDFVYGATYLLSTEAVAALLTSTQHVRAFYNEDVLFTGVVAQQARVTRVDVAKFFRTNGKIYSKERCANGVPVVTAYFDHWKPEQLEEKYHSLVSIPCN